ncbi:MAG TPA: hypothetical protein VFA41_03215 [Ktedonobacteraceae bacterium]|nr:hypothetical protein [Ktedonobacteraceae bacterium]
MSDRIPTLADLCSALADGSIQATCDGSMYHVNALELRRYLNRFRSLPTISSVDAPAVSQTSGWSVSTQPSAV